MIDKLVVKYLPLDKLTPYAANARTHPAEQIAKIRASLAEFGWTNPILHAEKQLIAGHGRLQAALAMRREGQAIAHHADLNVAPTIDLSHLSVEQRRAYVLADNRIAEDSGWDPELLRQELVGLMSTNVELELTGFDLDQFREAIFPKEEEKNGKQRDSRSRLHKGLTFQIVIECEDELEQATLLGDLQGKGVKCRPLIL